VNATGKKARKRLGTRSAAKRQRPRKKKRTFGKLPVSESRGNAKSWRESDAVEAPLPAVIEAE
jgi:hypothetical protein